MLDSPSSKHSVNILSFSSLFFIKNKHSLEIVQLLIGRVFDVDDIILNILGGLLGYGIYFILRRIGERLPNFVRKEWFLNTLSILILIGLTTGIVFILI